MSTFRLEINTPEETFFSGDAEAITMSPRQGSLTVLPGHQPMLVALVPGEVRVKIGGEWRSFLTVDGFCEVTGKTVVIYTRFATWETEAETYRSEKEKREAIELMRRQKSIFQHEHTRVELTRAMYQLGKAKKSANM